MAAGPVTWSESLAVAARSQALEMALLKKMGHRDSLDRGLAERLRTLGYRFNSAVENVAVGYPTLDAVVDAWIASEGHCENLMNPAVIEFGLACIDGNASGSPGESRYWALVLGAPRRLR
ncbi:MAG: CAP domain-containing protein [Pseudomonadota bacterium]|nr:CAP domain-containing protein [Pseudomonadota bacterium]